MVVACVVVVGLAVVVVACVVVVVGCVVVVGLAVVVVGLAVVVVDGCGDVVVVAPATVTVMRAALSFQWARPFQPAPKTPTLTTCAVVASFVGTDHVAVN